MAPFQDILFHAHGENAGESLKQTVRLARRNQGRVTVVDVIEPLSQLKRLALTAVMPADEFQEMRRTQARERLDSLLEEVRRKDVSIESRILEGRPAIELVRDVLRHDRDLLVRPDTGQASLGSEAMQLLRTCPCPVWITRGGADPRLRRILAAVDLDLSDEANAGLNDEILSIASTLAEAEGAKLHVAHAWSVIGEDMVQRRAPIGEVLRDIEAKRRRLLAELVEKHACDTGKTQQHLIKGLAEYVMPRLILSEGIDVAILGSVGRTGIAGFLMGNTAETILGEVGCSVLTLKPAGFQTPVALD